MIQTFKFDSPLQAMKTIAYLVAATVQFTCTHEDGQIHVCYPVGVEATLPKGFDETWTRILDGLGRAKRGARR